MSQLHRIKTLLQATFRRRPPERAEPGAPVTPLTLGDAGAVPQSGLTKFDADGHQVAVANVELLRVQRHSHAPWLLAFGREARRHDRRVHLPRQPLRHLDG
jgi:hypothetical protein